MVARLAQVFDPCLEVSDGGLKVMAIRASFAGRVGDLGVDENRHPITAERSGSRLGLGECPEGGTIMVSGRLMTGPPRTSSLAACKLRMAQLSRQGVPPPKSPCKSANASHIQCTAKLFDWSATECARSDQGVRA
jgi:hypothetical protein